MRNIVLFHLESLNQVIYKLNPDWFPNLRNWESGSVSFSNYYSSATSTLMVMSDMSYGTQHYNEACRAVRWHLEDRESSESMTDRFKKNGYRTLVLGWPDNPVDIPWVNDNGFVGQTVIMEEEETYSGYIERIESFINESDEPFFLWACSFVSNLSYNGELDQNIGKDGFTRRINGYKQVDDDVCYIMKALEDLGKLESTTVVFYGDHGDEFYSHGFYGGLTHAIPPYNPLIHTPLFIYDRRLSGVQKNELISTVDICNMIEALVQDGPISEPELLDRIIPKNKYVFSRNMFAAQANTNGVFEKAYTATDGDFLLMASGKGLEMYELSTDPMCGHDLLQYGVIHDGSIEWQGGIVNSYRYHAKSILDADSMSIVRKVFEEMYPELCKWIFQMYEAGDCCREREEIRLDIARNHFCMNRQEGFPDGRYFHEKKVVIYGAGEYGKKIYEYIHSLGEVVQWVDGNYASIGSSYGVQVASPKTISETDFDILYIAVIDPIIKRQIYDYIIELGISKEKILC